MTAEYIEFYYANKYKTQTTSRKDIGDIYVDGIPINIKSNNIDKENYSPNLISADKLFDHLNAGNPLKFLFVDYGAGKKYPHHDWRGTEIFNETWVDAHHISWDCLTIQCQGKGVLQVSSDLMIDMNQTREQFLKGFAPAYKTYFKKERTKLDKLEEKYNV